MSTSTHPAAPAAPPVQTGTSPALQERTTNGDRAPQPKSREWQIVLIPVERVSPNPWQPRTLFDPGEMEELTQSVKAHGVQQPVIVRTAKPKAPEQQNGDGATAKSRSKKEPVRFELVAGERRLRASVSAGKKSIPAIVRDDLSDLQVAEIALLENVQRSNLSAIEEGKGYRRLMLDFRLSEERLAKKVGKSVQVLRDTMKLLGLPEGVQQLIRLRKLTPAHGHELLKLAASSEACNSVAAYAVNAHLPATALAKDPLPTARELEKRGFVVPLDYRTRFDKAQCKSCPHKAHVAVGYAGYCLAPAEWKSKQEEVLEREKDEAARTLEEARRQSEAQTRKEGEQSEGEEAPEGDEGPRLSALSQLPRGSYRDLRFGDVPPGCSAACACRGCALDPHAPVEGGEEPDGSGARVPVCLNPGRFAELQKEERVRREEERKCHFLGRFENALRALNAQWHEGQSAKAAALAFTPFLDGRCARGPYLAPGQWQATVRRAADVLGMDVPLESIFGDDAKDAGILQLLSGQGDGDDVGLINPQRLALLGAGVLLALEAEGAARWGGETPLLDFVLPPASGEQTALALENDGEEGDDNGEWIDEDEDPFMEEDFKTASSPTSDGELENTQMEEEPEAAFCG